MCAGGCGEVVDALSAFTFEKGEGFFCETCYLLPCPHGNRQANHPWYGKCGLETSL